MPNEISLDTLSAALCSAMGIDAPKQSQKPVRLLTDYVEKSFHGQKADRIFLYHPDAVAQWLFEKYPSFLEEVLSRTGLKIPFRTVMPSVTPVCFGTMYTGVQPEVHGIRTYAKPVITVDTLFDRMIEAGKKPVIIAEKDCSVAKIFLERKMDYFIFDTIEEVNAKAAEVILEDRYDFIAVYNGNYDTCMHKTGTQSAESLAELRLNSHAFGVFYELIASHWKNHRTLLGFAMDHGCHDIDGSCGSHGLDMDEDMNILHCYQCL